MMARGHGSPRASQSAAMQDSTRPLTNAAIDSPCSWGLSLCHQRFMSRMLPHQSGELRPGVDPRREFLVG